MSKVIATFSMWVSPTVFINKGELWESTDPVVRSHPDWFADVESAEADDLTRRSTPKKEKVAAPKVVESASAAPGEKRTVEKPAVEKGGSATNVSK